MKSVMIFLENNKKTKVFLKQSSVTILEIQLAKCKFTPAEYFAFFCVT